MLRRSLLVMAFGGLGAILREAIILTIVGPLGDDNLAIFVANVAGCIIIGLVGGVVLWDQPLLGRKTKLVLTTGMAGGLTTFSSLIWATISQWPQESLRPLTAFWLVANVVICFFVVLLCLAIGKRLEFLKKRTA